MGDTPYLAAIALEMSSGFVYAGGGNAIFMPGGGGKVLIVTDFFDSSMEAV